MSEKATRTKKPVETAQEVVIKQPMADLADDTRFRGNGNATVEAPLGLKALTVFSNLGRGLGKVVNWYARLSEVNNEHLALRYRRKGMEAFQDGRFGMAAEAFRSLVELDAADSWACCMLARSLGKAGDASASVEWLRKAVALSPDDPEIHFQLGLFLSHQEQLEEAEAEFLKVVALAPSEAKGHYRLGVVYDKMGQYGKAAEALHRALEMRPQSPKICQRLGFVCEGKGDHAEALKYFKKAAELEDAAV